MTIERKEGINRGNAGKGRPKGSPNKTTQALKDAILIAAEKMGSNGTGEGGMIGYLCTLAMQEPKAFAGLLGRVLPMQVTGADDKPLSLTVSFVKPK